MAQKLIGWIRQNTNKMINLDLRFTKIFRHSYYFHPHSKMYFHKKSPIIFTHIAPCEPVSPIILGTQLWRITKNQSALWRSIRDSILLPVLLPITSNNGNFLTVWVSQYENLWEKFFKWKIILNAFVPVEFHSINWVIFYVNVRNAQICAIRNKLEWDWTEPMC